MKTLEEFTDEEGIIVLECKTGLTFKFPNHEVKEEFFDMWDNYEVIK